MNRNLTLTAAMLTLVVVTGTGCVDREHRISKATVVEREWPASEVTLIDLDGISGKIEVRAGDPGKISMRARVRVRGRHTDEKAADIVITKLDSGTLHISQKHKKRKRAIFIFPFSSSDASVSYELTVPPVMDLALTTVNGSIHLNGVGGKITLRSVNGSIEAHTTGGQVEARTVNGGVKVTFDRDFRGARVKTVNGSIRVSLPADSSFRSDVSLVNGSFKANVPLETHGRRSAEGDVNGGEFPLEISTVNGSVNVVRRDV